MNDPFGILTYDWTTMQYTKQSARLSGDRVSSACALLKGSSGTLLVAVAGGISQGMEAWNPADDSVATLTAEFPLPSEDVYTYEYPQMLSVKGNTELIFYESSTSNGSPKGIWKYSTLTSNWTKIGEMLFPRGSFSVVPVDGVYCSDDKH
jgi:hypothetical protein